MEQLTIPSVETLVKTLGIYDFKLVNIGRGDKDVFSGILQQTNGTCTTSIAVIGVTPGVHWGNLATYLLYTAAIMGGYTFPEEVDEVTPEPEVEVPAVTSINDDIRSISESMSGSEEEGDVVYPSSIFDPKVTAPVVEEAVVEDDSSLMDSFSIFDVNDETITEVAFDSSVLSYAAEITRNYIPAGKEAFNWNVDRTPEILEQFNPTITYDDEGKVLFLDPPYPKQSDGRYLCLKCGKPVHDNEVKTLVDLSANGPYHIKCWEFAEENNLLEEEVVEGFIIPSQFSQEIKDALYRQPIWTQDAFADEVPPEFGIAIPLDEPDWADFSSIFEHKGV